MFILFLLTLMKGPLESFMDKKNQVKNVQPKLLYISLIKESNSEMLDKISNCVIRAMMEKEVIDADNLQAMNVMYDHTTSLFRPMAYHITCMRIKKNPERQFDAAGLIEKSKKIGFTECTIKRLDISTRFEFADDKFYKPLSSLNL